MKFFMWEAQEGETVYFGIGSFIRGDCLGSQDQQIPPFLSLENNIKIYLIDACFRNDKAPVALQTVLNECEKSNDAENKNVVIYKRKKMTVYVMMEYLEEGKKWINQMKSCILLHQSLQNPVMIGVFCHPYYMNEDNKCVIDLYHSIINESNKTCDSLYLFLLADYYSSYDIPTSSNKQLNVSTRVWFLNPNSYHDQDLAVCKEVSRFYFRNPNNNNTSSPSPFESVNAGVAEYVYMNHKYGIGSKFITKDPPNQNNNKTTPTTPTRDVYKETEKQIITYIMNNGGPDSVLQINECTISNLPLYLTLNVIPHPNKAIL